MTAATPTNRRRCLRFGIRTMLFLMVLVAIPMAWKIRRVLVQKTVVEELMKAGGQVYYDYEVGHRKGPRASGEPTPPGPWWLRYLLGDDIFASVATVVCLGEAPHDDILALIPDLPDVVAVEVMGVTDDGVTYLMKSPGITSLVLYGRLTDSGVSRLVTLTHLEYLSLTGGTSEITDDGVAQLVVLHELEHLDLEGRFTDAAIVHLEKLSKLRWAFLDSPQLTDQCIPTLGRMATLRNLRVMGGEGFTEKGVALLQGLLPNCNVVRIPRPVLQNKGQTTSITE